MADIRINSLPTTASASSSDDFLALDGATNGTRKLNAYSPTFGGNLTVSGTGTSTFSSEIAANKNASNISFAANGSTPKSGIWTNNDGTMEWSDYATGTHGLSVNMTNGATVVSGNLTASGTGTSSVAGNFGIGTTSPEGRLHLAASASGATGSILVLDNPIASALNNSNQIAFLNDVGASYAGIANVRLKSLTTNAGNGSSAFTITTFDGSSEAERVRVFANGNFGIGTGSTDGGQKLQVSGTAYVSGDLTVGAKTGAQSTPDKLQMSSGYPNTSTPTNQQLKISLGYVSATQNYGFTTDSLARIWYHAGDTVGPTGGHVFATGGTTALTLDSSQRCILAGALRLNNAYVSGAPTATGYVTLQDSAGNTYKVLVGT